MLRSNMSQTMLAEICQLAVNLFMVTFPRMDVHVNIFLHTRANFGIKN